MKKQKFETSGIRQTVLLDFRKLTKKDPEKSLTMGKKSNAGRKASGEISVRHKGGGHKKLFRIIDFKQNKFNIEGKVSAIEYDPNRSAFIALVNYKDGEKKYILAPRDLNIGDTIKTSEQADLKPGNRLPLYKIPVGYFVHNVEFIPNKGGQLAKSAGGGVKIMAHDNGYTHLQLPSSEIRKIKSECWASLGFISNIEHNLINLGKAGRSRWLGKRPAVRGSVMNPCDHPHGGGEGKTGIGLKYSKTPWGKPSRGVKTRNPKKWSNKYIVKRRVK